MPKPRDPLAALEERIGYVFRDRSLLTRALTHTSASSSALESYQRLEFLGDRVLALAVASMTYRSFPNADEGELAVRLNALVKRETCARVGRLLDLGAIIRLGAGEAQGGGRDRVAILGDVTEALLAAIYLDGGFAPADAFVQRHWSDAMLAAPGPLRDAKTTLQEWAQGRGLPAPTYREVARRGPDHDPEFTIAVDIQALDPGEGRGRSKREAEQNAATVVLVREGVWAAPAGDGARETG